MAKGRIDDDEAAAIVATFQQTDNVRETAKRHGRAPSSVSKIINEAGLEPAGRSQTKIATATLAADNDARIELMMAKWLARHDREQERLDALDRGEQYRLVAVSAGVVIDRMVTTAPEENRQRILTMAAVATDKVKVLHSMRSDRREGKSLIEQLIEGLAA